MNESNIKLNSKIKMNNNDKIENMENIKNYIDEEINGLSYSMAVQYDKRNFWQYYVSLLKTQYNLICAIFYKNDYNSGMVKINLKQYKSYYFRFKAINEFLNKLLN